MLSRSKSMRLPGKRVVFDLETCSRGQNRCVCQANVSFLTFLMLSRSKSMRLPGKRVVFDLETCSRGQNRCVCQANVSFLTFLMLSRSKSMRLPGKRVVFDLESTKKHTRASNPRIWLAFAARGLVFQQTLAIIRTLTKQMQIPGLLAGVSFLVLSRSKSMRLPGKRVVFDLESTKKHTRASNPGICLAFASRGLLFPRSAAIISTLTKQKQIPGLLAGVSFLVLSRSKSTLLPGKLDLESTKKHTRASNPYGRCPLGC